MCRRWMGWTVATMSDHERQQMAGITGRYLNGHAGGTARNRKGFLIWLRDYPWPRSEIAKLAELFPVEGKS